MDADGKAERLNAARERVKAFMEKRGTADMVRLEDLFRFFEDSHKIDCSAFKPASTALE